MIRLSLVLLSIGFMLSISYQGVIGCGVVGQSLGICSEATDLSNTYQLEETDADIHSVCESCHSDDCNSIDSNAHINDKEWMEAHCDTDNRYILPLDIFLVPVDKKAPIKRKRSTPILS